MNPDNSSPGGDVPAPNPTGAPQPQPQPVTPAPTQPAAPQQDAAANVIRSQITALYGDSPVASPVASGPTTAEQQEVAGPYQRVHTERPAPTADQWKEYHTAWQNYYQKYYSNYYATQHSAPTNTHYFAHTTEQPESASDEEVTNDEALFELRKKLLGKVKERAGTIRRSKHFIPILAAVLVVLVFVFLQYNRVLISTVAAYVSPGSIDPQNIVIDPSSDVIVGPEPRLIIPKINVDVPVLYDVGADYDSQMKAMESGVAHFSIPGASSHPGEIGNTAIAGHSSNDLFDRGDYKFIFAQLEKLEPGDSIYANYKGKRYTYVVTKKEVVRPNEINKLIYPTDKPVMTLITCTPLGTAIDRLLVTAEQVSPDPAQAAAAPAGSGEGGDTSSIPGNSPTFFERLFGIGGN